MTPTDPTRGVTAGTEYARERLGAYHIVYNITIWDDTLPMTGVVVSLIK